MAAFLSLEMMTISPLPSYILHFPFRSFIHTHYFQPLLQLVCHGFFLRLPLSGSPARVSTMPSRAARMPPTTGILVAISRTALRSLALLLSPPTIVYLSDCAVHDVADKTEATHHHHPFDIPAKEVLLVAVDFLVVAKSLKDVAAA